MLSESPSENNETFLGRRIDTPLPGMGLLLKLLWGDRYFGLASIIPAVHLRRHRGRKTQPRFFANSVRCLPVYIQPQRCFQPSTGKIFRASVKYFITGVSANETPYDR
ncbi:hypothetical protein K0M31_006506 [Melipona bicolor]|uniref:Uncharacterized protein n=1 Tax=Melipona bicolor TaxID=60889 RepID=A0AA40FUD5_9HYME|nr:hypothetical protein K0M31_006506 [Melipona bicolor]